MGSLCPSCKKENGVDSKFCRHCGNQLKKGTELKVAGFHIKIPTHLSRRSILIGSGVVIGLIIVVVAGPKAYAYFEVENALRRIPSLEASGDYQKAIDVLMSTEGKWTTPSNQSSIASLKVKENENLKWQGEYNTALSDIQKSQYKNAESLLRDIEATFPQFREVQEKLTEVQTDVENDLNAKISSADAAAAQARAEKAQADAAAAAASNARAAAEQQAEAAQAQAQAEAANAAHQALVSFYNQVNTMLASYKQGISYYNTGMSYYNAGECSPAIVSFGQANAVFSKVDSDATNLPSTFTNMPESYLQAASNLAYASYYEDEATQDMLSNCGPYSSGSLDVTSLVTQAYSYVSLVAYFIANTTP